MSYFKNVDSYENLKAQYKSLALANHPDRGGELRKMQDINVEYDILYAVWYSRSEEYNETSPINAKVSRRYFYSQYGWEGDNYDSNLSKKDIVAIIRKFVKTAYPNCRFSVTRQHYNSIYVSLMKADFNPFVESADDIEINSFSSYHDTVENIRARYQDIINRKYYSDVRNYKNSGILSDYGQQMLVEISSFVNSYNFDDSDIQSDYFHVNFYFTLAIGKWDKPFEQTGSVNYATSKNVSNKK